jgi:hypothetical protein
MPHADAMLIVRFWDAKCYEETDTVWDQITRKTIAAAVGHYTHVDVLVYTREEPCTVLMSFTTFEGECFKGALAQSQGHDKTQCLKLDITIEEAQEITKRCWNLDARDIPYNFSDSRLLVPFWSPCTAFIDDVTTDTLSTAFCSQIIILILRECLHPDRETTKILEELNSRTTAPNTLYNHLKVSEASPISLEHLSELFVEATLDQRRFVRFN